MARLLILGFLALLTIAEVAAVLALVEWLGPFGAMVLLALDVLVGLMVMRWAVRGPVKDRGFRLTAGAFIALPGLVLDLVGVALLIPPVREWLRARITRGTESALRRGGISVVTVTAPGDVIPGSVVVEETTVIVEEFDLNVPADNRPYGTDEQPRVIRGEIVSGDSPEGEPGESSAR
jgi:UPF0716 protein FxsA